MAQHLEKIGFGGGCHWCTEAVFQAVEGVLRVDQGWIAAEPPNDRLSEAVIAHFDPALTDIDTLIDVHTRTHASAADHSMRAKYRSAVYCFSPEQRRRADAALSRIGAETGRPLITKSLMFLRFKPSDKRYANYYETHADRPFSRTYIEPKLQRLRDERPDAVKAGTSRGS
ncbi:MAG: peptide-methionine (S)-S-oxide reductase [Pseudomonadota bacterium]